MAAFLVFLLLHCILAVPGYEVKKLNKFHRPRSSLRLPKERESLPKSTIPIGTSFVYSYLNSHAYPDDNSYTENLYLTVTNPGNMSSTVSVSSLFPGFNNQTVTVPGSSSLVLSITPISIQVNYRGEHNTVGTNMVKEHRAIWVSATQPVSLIATNQLSNGKGANKFTVFPICTLDADYRVVSDDSAKNRNSPEAMNIITIIGIEDHTYVIYNDIFKRIDRGEQLTVVSSIGQNGEFITADKPVAAITGTTCGYGYYSTNSHCSHEALMLYPTGAWETHFPLYNYRPTSFSEVYIFVESDNTRVRLGNDTMNVDSYFYLLIKVGDQGQGGMVVADKPIYAVATAANNDDGQGGPFFAHVPSPDLFTEGPVVITTGLPAANETCTSHYVKIVTAVAYAGSISVDGYVPERSLYTEIGESPYSYCDLPISPGDNHVIMGTEERVTFSVTVYGYGDFQSYGFTPALNLPIASSVQC